MAPKEQHPKPCKKSLCNISKKKISWGPLTEEACDAAGRPWRRNNAKMLYFILVLFYFLFALFLLFISIFLNSPTLSTDHLNLTRSHFTQSPTCTVPVFHMKERHKRLFIPDSSSNSLDGGDLQDGQDSGG